MLFNSIEFILDFFSLGTEFPDRCALAGDVRVNEQPTLGSFHLLFVREHNRIARELKRFNPRWNDEKLYQETKRIVNAEWQHIIYNEWLPQLIGVDLLKRFDLSPLIGKEFSNKYRYEICMLFNILTRLQLS